MPRTLLALTLAILLTPVAAAWPWDPYEIRVRDLHAGDVWRIAEGEGEELGVERLVLVEGTSRARDAFGIERDTVSFRVERRVPGGEYNEAARCHILLRGNELVRKDFLAGRHGGSSETVISYGLFGDGRVVSEENETTRTTFHGDCDTRAPFPGKSLREGDTIRLADIIPGGVEEHHRSGPAVRAEFEGRRALLFSFDVREIFPEAPPGAYLQAILAHDLPAPALIRYGAGEEVGRIELVGFSPGSGARIDREGGERLPAEHPALAPFDPRSFDDSALGLPVRYAEAYHALVNDPRADARAWLDAHPDAILVQVHFDHVSSEDPSQRVPYWDLEFRDGNERAGWTIVKRQGPEAPTALSALVPALAFEVFGGAREGHTDPLVLPERALAIADAVALANAEGAVDLAPRVSYFLHNGPSGTSMTLHLTEIRGDVDQRGTAVHFDLARGRIDRVSVAAFDVSNAPGIDASAAATLEAAEAPLPAPAAIAGATVAGLALLALVLKVLLLPLYTRLRRDRLLDNPVRARLFDLVRAEPGIHLAAIEEHLGIGKGATRHHVDQLARHRLVFLLEEDGFTRCYVSGHVPPEVARRTAVLRAGSHARVYELYVARPGLPLRAAAKELGMSAPSVHRAKKRLEKEGLLPAAAGDLSITLR